MNPLYFTIVIPSYNRADFIYKTIQSFLAQEYGEFEILVVDDGSKDNTREVVENINDRRITYFYKTNGERGAARNYGAARAKGDYITFFDSDDLVYPWYLKNAADKISRLKFPECFAQAFEFRNDVPLQPPNVNVDNSELVTINERIMNENILACNGVFIRKDIFSQFQFSENRDLSGSEDWFLWLQLSAKYAFHYSPVVGSCLINHEQRGEMNIRPDKLEKRLNLLLEYIKNDKYITAQPKQAFGTVLSTGYRFAALKRADFTRLKFKSIGNLFKAFFLRPSIIGYRTTLVTIKKLLFSWHS